MLEYVTPAVVTRSMFESPAGRVEWVCCRRTHPGPSGEERKSEHQIMVPLSGVNVRHVNGAALAVSPSRVTLSNRDEPYRVSHPYGSGETALTLVLREDLLLDILRADDPAVMDRERPFVRRQIPADAELHLAVQCAVAALRRAELLLEREELTLLLAERILRREPEVRDPSPRDREIAERARAFVAAHSGRPIQLRDVAAAVGLSVFQLCRRFRRATGHTVWREVQRLRVRAALVRLAAGERDLSALGLATGFAHHSHFTATMRRELGLTPSAVRRLLDAGSPSQVRRLLAR